MVKESTVAMSVIAAAITLIARRPPYASSPEILLDGAIDQV